MIRPHGRCAVEGCTNPDRTAAIKAHAGRWHLVHGHIWSSERHTFVVPSAAEACDAHRAQVIEDVRADVQTWHDRWRVQVRTLDYGDYEAGGVEEVAHGIGTPEVEDGRLF